MQPVCFAPSSHAGGMHDSFEASPFGRSSDIWIGYLDEPEKTYRHFDSLDTVVDKAQENYEHGYKNSFPRYQTTYDGRAGHSVSVHEDLLFSAQCSACKDKGDGDRVLMQYFPIVVWDYARNRKTNIFVSTNQLRASVADMSCTALCASLQDRRPGHARTPVTSIPWQVWLPAYQRRSLEDHECRICRG